MKAGIAQSGRTILAALTAALLVFSMMAVFADTADANHIPATGPLPGNCVNFQAGNTGTASPLDFPDVDITLDSWTNTSGDPHTVSFTISGLATGQHVDISVKSGTNLQEAGPYGNGSFSYSNGLKNAISHIRLCVFEEEIPPQPGQIIVQKVVTAGSDTSQSFEFTADYDGDGFSLADGQSNNSGDLDAGTYSVAETVPEGWTLVSAICDDDSDPSSIDLAAGETVTCTFTNDETPPQPGVIIVEKEVTEGSDTTQSFDFTADYDADGFSLADGESNNSGNLDAGTYAVSETVPTGWTLDSATCDDGSDPSSIDLAAGETVTCTFVNDETPPPPPPEVGEIVVQKVVTGDASQTFEFTFNTVGFTLGDNTLAHGQSSSSGDVAAGDGYSVSEDLPTGWTQVSATCDDGSPITNIDVAAGETVTCTFTNTIESNVQASIVVTVDGSCELDGDEGEGIIDVEISVDGGADVVISDSDGDVIETLSSSGTVTVPEGATYTWAATPNEGFEFPAGSDTSGSITIETCSDDPETLPFTGLDTGMMSLFATALLGGGLLLVTAMRRQEEA